MKKISAWLRRGSTFVYRLMETAAEHRVGPYAAQASFFIILSLVPFFMFLLSLIRLVLPYFLQISDADLVRTLNELFPYRTALVMEDVVHDVFTRSSGISVVTAGMAVWFSSRGLMAINQGVNNVLSDGELQNYFFCRIMSVIYVFVFALLVALTVILGGFGKSLAGWAAARFSVFDGVIYRILNSRYIIMFLLLTFFFTLFYKFMPKHRWHVRELVPGAALAAGGWIVFSKGFGIYIGLSRSYDSIYGSISYIIFGMLWLYFCLNIMLLGAEFNRLLKFGKRT
ncbi:MAG: YihY/virulence factor BrkB family protein [bacterium]|nr:YihY/virulence factor BrkB family protein [bacterium]